MNKSIHLISLAIIGLYASTALEALEDACYLHPVGPPITVTGDSCPNVDPWLKTEVNYRCEECGDLGDLIDMDVTGYGDCLYGTPACFPSLNSVDYQIQHVTVSIQNRRYVLICLRTGVSTGTAICDCPTSCDPSPIIISLDNSAIRLTDAENGVFFDLDVDGLPDQTAWTESGSDEAFLALDRNGNGLIDDGSELFGDHTPQPIPPSGDERNGFAALAVFDDSLSGGNENGLIDEGDDIFSSLRLWIDSNHNGFSESDELRSLPDGQVVSIHLDYEHSARKDRHGNAFRYRSVVELQARMTMAWDVFFVQLD